MITLLNQEHCELTQQVPGWTLQLKVKLKVSMYTALHGTPSQGSVGAHSTPLPPDTSEHIPP